MLNTSISPDLQYMHDVGVSEADVKWLESEMIAGRKVSAKNSPRGMRIEEQAYAGLLATIRTPSINAVSAQ
jgi:hypothetical protein